MLLRCVRVSRSLCRRMLSSSSSTGVELSSGPLSSLTSLVSPKWLKENLSSVSVLDASWYMPATQRNTREEYLSRHIAGAKFFDIDVISDTASGLPHMLPSDLTMKRAVRHLGLSLSTPIIVYDTAGIFSAPRVWWTLKAFGHERVAVLNGGLPRWLREGFELEAGGEVITSSALTVAPTKENEEPWALRKELVCDFTEVLSISAASGGAPSSSSSSTLLVDARPAARFRGEAPEPRAGLASGHIPGSVNVPFSTVLDDATKTLLPPAALGAALSSAAGVDYTRAGPIVASCGSGITACVVALSLHSLGRPFEATRLYDGSWSEYGNSAGPIAVST